MGKYDVSAKEEVGSDVHKREYFLGMQSNQRSESLNSRLHNHLDRKMSLVDLVEHYEFCLSRIHRNEIELDAKALVSTPFTKISANELEKSAAQTFTPIIFRRVMTHIRKGYNWSVREVVFDNGALRYEVALQSNSQRFFPRSLYIWVIFG